MFRHVPLVLALAVLAAPGVRAKAAPPAPPVRYGLVLLEAGDRPALPRAVADSLQAGHLANIRRMFELGALAAAGPCGDDGPLRGIFVFEPDSLESLPRLLEPDPIVHAGRLVPEPHVWITDAGIGAAYRRHREAAPGARDSMVPYTLVLLRRGPKWTANVTPGLPGLLERQRRELDRQRAARHLALAGPIEGTGALRGVYVYAADTAAARRLVARDPAVKAGRFVPELHPWWTAYGVVPGH